MSTINYKRLLKGLGKGMLLICLLSAVSISCKKTENFAPSKVNAPLALSLSADSAIVLNEANKFNTALTFNWTTGSNYGTGASISYTLEIDKKGGDFSNAIKTSLGKAVYTLNYTAGSLNSLVAGVWSAAPDTAIQLQVRIVDSISASGVKGDTSAVLYLSVTPYKPVSQTLFIFGDATVKGTDPTVADSLTPDPVTPGLFHYQGTLTPGHFNFITTLGSILPAYDEGADSTRLVYRQNASDPDNEFSISSPSVYQISVNLISLTITYTPAALPLYKQLWIVGDATPNGWNITGPNVMTVDPFNAFIFHYNQVLTAGEFKMPTALGNWSGDYYRPLTDDPPITDTNAVLVLGLTNPPDNKWQITNPGPYKISLNIGANSIQIIPFIAFTQLWMVGDATPAGWNINTPQVMTPTPGDPYTYTYSGPLTVGEFKIPVTTGNFNCPYFRPEVNHPAITDTLAPYVPVHQDPADVNDFKWYISVAGNYKVSLNQLTETISIQQQ